MNDRPSVLAIGEPLIELSDIGNQRLEWTFGGDTFNCLAAIVAAAPTTTGRYLTGLGDDPASAWFTEFARALRIDMSSCPVITDRNIGLSWISRQDGDRTFRYWRGESAARAALQDGLSLGDRHHSLIVISSITLAVAGPGASSLVAAVAESRRAGARVALDTNHRAVLWPSEESARAAIEQALEHTDVLHASLDDVAAVWNEDAETFCDRMTTMGVAEVIVTDGPGPIVVRRGSDSLTVEPPSVEVADATGAGDAFFGTYLGRRLEGDDVDLAVERAIEVATRVVQSRGALTYLNEAAG